MGAFGSAAYDSYVSSAAHHYPPGVRATSMADMIPPPPPPPGEGPLEGMAFIFILNHSFTVFAKYC